MLFIAYDEEVNGFTFTRTRAKRAKPEPVLPPTIEEDKPEERTEPQPTKRIRRKSPSSPTAAPHETEKPPRRRSARLSDEHENADPPLLHVKKKRRDRNSSEKQLSQTAEPPVEKEQSQTARAEEPNQDQRPIEISFDATKIALPFADTPRIQRNKDMRKTQAARRSSLGLRGRRASSLIDAGKSTGNFI